LGRLYAELKNYYQLAERRMAFTRTQRAFPHAGVEQLQSDVRGAKEKLGYKRVHTGYLAINPKPFDRPRVLYSGRASARKAARPAPSGARSTQRFRGRKRPETFDLRIQCMATAHRARHGRARDACRYRDAQGNEQRQKARIVCVARQCDRDATATAAVGVFRSIRTASRIQRPGGAQLHATTSSTSCGGVLPTKPRAWPVRRRPRLAGLIEDPQVNEPKRGLSVGGYHFELCSARLPTFPLVGIPYGWGSRLRIG